MEKKINQAISKKINSKNFLSRLQLFSEKIRGKIIGLTIEHYIILRSFSHLEEYLELLLTISKTEPLPKGNYWNIDNRKNKFYKKYIAIDHEITAMNNLAKEKKILSHLKQNFIENGFFYHSYHSAHEKSIMKEGLKANKRIWKPSDINRVKKILAMYGEYREFGFIEMNCENNLSVSDNFQSLYKYAQSSPEWFNIFTSSGYHLPTSGAIDKGAYAKKDYKIAQRNIETFLNYIGSNNQLNKEARPKLRAMKIDINKIFRDFIGANKNTIGLIEENEQKIFFELVKRKDNQKILASLENQELSSFERGFIFFALFNKFMQALKGPPIFKSMSAPSKRIILDFFEKYWKLYGKKGSLKCALVERRAIKNSISNHESINKILKSQHPDYQIKQSINSEFLHIINLPDYNKVFI